MKKAYGFTLIELMVVIIIIAILAAIALPSYSQYITKAKTKNASADLITLSVVLEGLYQRSLKYPIPITNPTTTTAETKTFAAGWQPTESETFDYTVNMTESSYALTATGKTGSRNAGCTLSLDNTNTRTISGAMGCGGVNSW